LLARYEEVSSETLLADAEGSSEDGCRRSQDGRRQGDRTVLEDAKVRSDQVRIGKTAWIRKTFYVRFVYVQEESIRKNRFFSISKLGSFSSLLYFT